MQLGASGPLFPKADGLVQRLFGIDRLGKVVVRRPVGEREGHRLSRANSEFAESLKILAAQPCSGIQDGHIGAGNRPEPAILQTSHPRNGASIIEAQDQLHAHCNAAANAAHNANQVGTAVAERHEVEQDSATPIGLKGGFHDQRVIEIAPRAARLLFRGN